MTTRYLIISLSIMFLFTSCHAQTEKDSIEQKVVKKLQKWAENPSFSKDTFDLKIFDQLKDSGQSVNNIKQGIWIEYSIDSSLVGMNSKVVVGDKSLDFNPGITPQKSVGIYKDGKREGKWTTYESFNKRLPLYWDIKSETDYASGLKNGAEIFFRGYGQYQKPFIITHYKNGIENGEGKIYNLNYPYKLQKVYIATNGHLSLTQEYYDDGKPHFLINDTIINNQKLKFFRNYDEQTNLVQTGYYLNDTIMQATWTEFYLNGKTKSITNYNLGLEDGSYKYFHDNGQLWTELTFEKGKTKDVICNFDRNGKAMDKGTLKNGNGTVIHYEENGKQRNVQEFKNGQTLK